MIGNWTQRRSLDLKHGVKGLFIVFVGSVYSTGTRMRVTGGTINATFPIHYITYYKKNKRGLSKNRKDHEEKN